MPNLTGKSGGGPFKMKIYGQGKNPIQMNSPLKQDKKDTYTKEDYAFLKEQREERVKSTDYLTVPPTGPRATKKKVKDEWTHATIIPGYEDPIKIQKLQREGLVPGSQKFMKKK